ncbi:hypothetical protein [uncultured Hoeflea sp.]|uniref:hypothetical protein n=1 Tax=uncultured Hoeflea sp. TaxID=538666 RepID=UPI0030D9FE2D
MKTGVFLDFDPPLGRFPTVNRIGGKKSAVIDSIRRLIGGRLFKITIYENVVIF